MQIKFRSMFSLGEDRLDKPKYSYFSLLFICQKGKKQLTPHIWISLSILNFTIRRLLLFLILIRRYTDFITNADICKQTNTFACVFSGNNIVELHRKIAGMESGYVKNKQKYH